MSLNGINFDPLNIWGQEKIVYCRQRLRRHFAYKINQWKSGNSFYLFKSKEVRPSAKGGPHSDRLGVKRYDLITLVLINIQYKLHLMTGGFLNLAVQ
jgi:hypothetical protein